MNSILYIDSNPKDIGTLKQIVNNQYNIIEAGSIEEVERILKNHKIHLVIFDQQMPGMSDIEFLETINSKIPVVKKILTGYKSDRDIIIRALNSGYVFRFVPKPFSKHIMLETIKSGIDLYKKTVEKNKRLESLSNIFHEMNFLHEISHKISEKKPLPKLLKEIMESSKSLMNAEASSLLLYDPEDKKLHFQVATGEKGKTVSKYSVNLGDGIAGWVAKHKKQLLIEDCYNDSRFNPEYDKKTNFVTRSMMCVPLIRKGQLLGVMQVLNKKNGGIFKESDLAIFETLSFQCAIAIENAKLIKTQIETEALERELETARAIQEKLLPSSLPEYKDLQVAAKLIPARQVGGDYYNMLKITDNQSLFFVADVAGKGIPAALIVSTIYTCLVTYIKMNGQNINLIELADSMNKVLIEATTIDKYATCWFGLLDHTTKSFISLNAGHNSPLIFNKNCEKPQVLHIGGIFLGSMDVPFEIEKVQLKKDDVLLFFSDGVTEAWNKKNEDYEEFRLIEVVNKNVHLSAPEILLKIEEDVQKHVGSAVQSDDFTCAVVKVN